MISNRKTARRFNAPRFNCGVQQINDCHRLRRLSGSGDGKIGASAATPGFGSALHNAGGFIQEGAERQSKNA
jgi:hypothetical protein